MIYQKNLYDFSFRSSHEALKIEREFWEIVKARFYVEMLRVRYWTEQRRVGL